MPKQHCRKLFDTLRAQSEGRRGFKEYVTTGSSLRTHICLREFAAKSDNRCREKVPVFCCAFSAFGAELSRMREYATHRLLEATTCLISGRMLTLRWSRPSPIYSPLHGRLQVTACLLDRDDVAVARFDVLQVGLVRQRRAVADCFPDYQRTKPVLSCVDGARAHAAARHASSDQQCVDLHRLQARGEIGAEERRAVLLRDRRRSVAWRGSRWSMFVQCEPRASAATAGALRISRFVLQRPTDRTRP